MLFGDDLPPCTNLALRLRIPADVASTATLSPAHGATGLWRAALRAVWDGRRGHDIERNRAEIANGAVVDIENAPAKDNFLMLKLTAHGIFQPVPCQGGINSLDLQRSCFVEQTSPDIAV